jgi:DNA polymerase III alpha subunit
MPYVHLHVHSNFSYYDGAAPLGDLMEAAARLDMSALALTDHNGLAGAVRFYRAAQAVL